MLTREEIYKALAIESEYVARHENTARVMIATNLLLDMLIQLNLEEPTSDT